MFTFRYHQSPEWPALAWIARLTPGKPEVLVLHGPRVETCPQWFGEIIWTGDWAGGDFDLTDVVFGSGGRIRDNEIRFVSAGSTVDRLQSIKHRGRVWVSNSLACLLGQVGAAPDPTDSSHFDRFGTIARGIDDYERILPTMAGPVRLTYFRNLVWDGASLTERDKPDSVPEGFRNFEQYREFLVRSLRGLARNAGDAQRRFSLGMMGTISGGIDSPAVAVLAKEAFGLSQAIGFQRPDGSDSGQAVADALGISLKCLGRDDWHSATEAGDPPEAAFIAADAKGEDVFMRPAGPHFAGKVLLSGHYCGLMWDRNRQESDASLRRKDRSGTALTEWRLHAGFIHCPVGFAGARHAADLMRISRSPEMDRWSVGGWYDKPIGRRIIEEAGISRGMFAVQKRAGSILFFRGIQGMSPAGRRQLQAWLRRHSGRFISKGKPPPMAMRAVLRSLSWAAVQTGSLLARASARMPRGRGGRLKRASGRLLERGHRDPLFAYAFPWAMDLLKRHYYPTRDFRPADEAGDNSTAARPLAA